MKGAHTYRLLLCIRLLFHCTGWHKKLAHFCTPYNYVKYFKLFYCQHQEKIYRYSVYSMSHQCDAVHLQPCKLLCVELCRLPQCTPFLVHIQYTSNMAACY